MIKQRQNKSTAAPDPSPKQSTLSLANLVRKNVLFSNVNKRTLERIATKLIQQHYKSGETIFDESTKGRDLYLILTGKVNITKYTKYGNESLLAVLHEGDFFGELSLIGGFPRSARAFT